MKELPKYEPPRRSIENHPDGKFVLKCGNLNDGGMELHAMNSLKLAELTTGVMAECHRLRWMLRQLDHYVGGTILSDVAEATQPDYEVLVVEETP